jgi:hypothetical protein
MDPHVLTIVQLKNILRQYNLPTTGKKVELVRRMQTKDPTGAWIGEAARHVDTVEEEEDLIQIEGATAQEQEATGQEDDLLRREAELLRRERSIMQREIDLLRRENDVLRSSPRSVASTGSRTTMSIKNVSDLLSEYNGSSDDFERWKAQINLLRNTYELDENSSKILVGSRLKGKAREWYYSLADNLILRVDELLMRMDAMFNQPIGRLERRRQFETRRWKKTETFSDYCHDKLILGNRVPIAESEMVDYVIEGIPLEDLRNQAQMHSFTTVQELLKGFRKIKLTACETTMTHHEYTGTRYTKPRTTTPKENMDGLSKPKVTLRGSSKCYNCEQAGHYAKDCPAKKRDRTKPREAATKEKRTERQVGLVDVGQTVPAEEDSDTDNQGEEDEEVHFVDLRNEPRDEFQRSTNLQLGGNQISCTARIDTGCPITLIKENVVKNIDTKNPDAKWSRYRGINNSRLKIVGLIKGDITIDGENQPVTVGVVPDSTMSIPLLIGRDTLKSFGYRLTKNIELDKAIGEILNINCEIPSEIDSMNINPGIAPKHREKLVNIFSNCYCKPDRPELPSVRIEAVLTVKVCEQDIHVQPCHRRNRRRLLKMKRYQIRTYYQIK